MSHRQHSTPSFAGLRPASNRASVAAQGASKKAGTRCEIILRRELWKRGFRYRIQVSKLPGRPDIVFPKARVAVFCDGDFWHGRNLDRRLAQLKVGHNSGYWVAKLQRNVARDRENQRALEGLGWTVVRVWETDVLREPAGTTDRVVETIVSLREARLRRRPVDLAE